MTTGRGSTTSRLKRLATGTLRLVPTIGRIFTEFEELRLDKARTQRLQAEAPQFVPPGHFYSPIPPLEEVRRNQARLWSGQLRDVPGVDLRETAQLALLEEFKGYYPRDLFPVEKTPGRRYAYANPAYSYADAIFLHCMLRHCRPRRLIEVGSGYSSAMTLDTNELFFDNRIKCTFIEPYPELLRSLLAPGDAERIEIIGSGVQGVPVQRFEALEAGDVLFIDSTHVSRIGSDVNYLFFEILPRLKAGVFVHFHDVFAGFEYPQVWIEEGRTWTELYLLRTFLQYNDSFEIVAFNTFLERCHAGWFEQHMPLCLKNPGGSIWLRKTR
jgi:hypothetical protein